MSLALAASPGYDLSAGYFRIANVVYDHYLGQLDVYELRLYQAIARHANRHGVAWLRKRTLAAEAGCSYRKVRYALQTLEALGLLACAAVFDEEGGQRANTYQLRTPLPGGHLQVLPAEQPPCTTVPPPVHEALAAPQPRAPQQHAPRAPYVHPLGACTCTALKEPTPVKPDHEKADRRATARGAVSPDEKRAATSTQDAGSATGSAAAPNEELPAVGAAAPAVPNAPEVTAAAPTAPEEGATDADTADDADATEAVPATAAELAPNSRQKGAQRPATVAKGLVDTWRTVLGDLRETTTPVNYTRWLSQTRLVGYAEGVATVAAPDQVTLEQVRKRFEPLLRWELTDALGQPVTVRYRLG